jgi:hypothetical protein
VSLQPQPARFALCSRRAGNRSARALSEPFVLYAAGPEFISSDPNARFFSKRASRCPNLFARSLQSGSPGGLSIPARHVSRRPCQGVKESRLIEQARLWRPHARLPPAWLLTAGRTRVAVRVARAARRGGGSYSFTLIPASLINFAHWEISDLIIVANSDGVLATISMPRSRRGLRTSLCARTRAVSP